MRYAPIGLQEQAKALAGMRVPKAFGKKNWRAEKQCSHRYGSRTRSAESQPTSSSDTAENGEDEPGPDKDPRRSEG